MKDSNDYDVLKIKKNTKDRLYEIKKRETFDKLLNDLIDSSDKSLRKKTNFFGR